jgi:acyl-CoA thioesterase
LSQAVLDEVENLEKAESDDFELSTHLNIFHSNSYIISKLTENHAILEINSSLYQKVDESGDIWIADIYQGASISAIAAINEKNFIIINSQTDFLNPIREDGDIIFEAKVDINTPIKKSVDVTASINDIKFFQGNFFLVKFDNSKDGV